jgi:hypothetical protein
MKLLDVIYNYLVEQGEDELKKAEDSLAAQTDDNSGEELIKKKRKRIDPNEKKGIPVPTDTKGTFSTNIEKKPTPTTTEARFRPGYRVSEAVLSDGVPFLCVWDLSSHVTRDRMGERNVAEADIDNILMKLQKEFLEYYLVQNTDENGDFTFENGLDIDQQRFRANQKDNSNFWISGHIRAYARKNTENNSLEVLMAYDQEDWYKQRVTEYFNKYPEVQEMFIVRITSTHKDPPLGALYDKEDTWKKPSHFDVTEEDGEIDNSAIKLFVV